MRAFAIETRRATRSLFRDRRFLLLAAVMVAIGVAATGTALAVARLLVYDALPFEQGERIVVISGVAASPRSEPARDPVSWLRHADALEDVGTIDIGYATVAGRLGPEHAVTAVVSASTFRVLRLQPVSGRLIGDADESPLGDLVCVVSPRFAAAHWGSAAGARGASLLLNGRTATVVGVAARDAGYLSAIEVWLCRRPGEDTALSRQERLDGIPSSIHLLARLRRGSDLSRARAQVELLQRREEQYSRQRGRSSGTSAVRVVPLKSVLARPVMPTVGILLAGAIILLGAATANVSNLILTRTWLRRRELSTRVALGAGVRDAITHVLLENVLFGAATALLSLPCAYLGIIAVRRFAPGGLPGLERLEFDGALGIYTCGLALAAAVIGSIAPSVAVARLGRLVPITRGAATDRSLRPRVLVCLQVGLSTVVLAYALVLVGAYVRVQSKTYGFDTRNRIGAEVSLPAFNCAPECQQLVCASAVLELGQLGKVENVALADRVPGGRKPLKSLWCERLDAYSGPARGDVSGLCAVTSVSSLYFRTLGLGLMAGRPFSDGEASPVVVVNDVVARRMWSVESAVGKRLRLTDERDREVVGVVPSVEEPGLVGVEHYQVYVPVQQSPLLAGETVGVLIHSTETGSEFVDSVRRRLAGVDQRLIIDRIATMDDLLAASTSTVRLQAMGIGVFGVGVLLLAAGGIYSTTAFVTAQQSREMAIRSAIGARRRDLLMGPMRFALGTAAIGWAVGVVTLPATHVLASRLGLPDTESGMLVVGATLVISAATVVAAGMSAGRRATTVDPARLLRE